MGGESHRYKEIKPNFYGHKKPPPVSVRDKTRVKSPKVSGTEIRGILNLIYGYFFWGGGAFPYISGIHTAYTYRFEYLHVRYLECLVTTAHECSWLCKLKTAQVVTVTSFSCGLSNNPQFFLGITPYNNVSSRSFFNKTNCCPDWPLHEMEGDLCPLPFQKPWRGVFTYMNGWFFWVN